jgi:hypothetical protein
MAERVECRADLDYADTPLALVWDGRRLVIDEVLARWRIPVGKGFRVRTVENRLFELFYDETKEDWHIQAL